MDKILKELKFWHSEREPQRKDFTADEYYKELQEKWLTELLFLDDVWHLFFKEKLDHQKKEIFDFIIDERTKCFKNTDEFNQFEGEYRHGYWMALNTILKKFNI